MSSLKRKRAENTADFRVYVGKENEDPDCKSPKRKQGRTAEGQIRPSAFGERSSNLSTHKKMANKENGGSEVSAHLPHSGVGGSPIRPRNKEKSEEDQDPMNILGENHGTLSPCSPRVDNYFPKIYKKGSPTKKRDNPERSPGQIVLCAGVDCRLSIALNIKMMLLERSKSVCNIDVTGAESKQGTGFVWVDNLIMTCAHLFRGFLEGKNLKEGTNVSVLFNFHGPQPNSNSFALNVEKTIVAISEKLDYILLKLRPNPNQRVPAGLLELFGPLPENGKIFIIGHPRREAKTFYSTVVIEPGMRQRAVYNHLAPYKDNFVEIFQDIMDQGIQDVMIGGVKANQVKTYITGEMYEGASGSPGLNSDGHLTLLHTGGYGYRNPHMIHSVLEYGQRLDLIIPDLVCQLKESGNVQLLERIDFVSTKNEHLKEVLEAEPMEVD